MRCASTGSPNRTASISYFPGSLLKSNFSEPNAHYNAQTMMLALQDAILELIIIFGFGSIASFFRGWLYVLAGQRLVARLRCDLFRALTIQEIAFFDKNRTGDLISRLSSDTQVIQDAVTVNVSMALRFGLQIVGAIFALFSLSWKLTLVMLSVVPVWPCSVILWDPGPQLWGAQNWELQVPVWLVFCASVLELCHGARVVVGACCPLPASFVVSLCGGRCRRPLGVGPLNSCADFQLVYIPKICFLYPVYSKHFPLVS